MRGAPRKRQIAPVSSRSGCSLLLAFAAFGLFCLSPTWAATAGASAALSVQVEDSQALQAQVQSLRVALRAAEEKYLAAVVAERREPADEPLAVRASDKDGSLPVAVRAAPRDFSGKSEPPSERDRRLTYAGYGYSGHGGGNGATPEPPDDYCSLCPGGTLKTVDFHGSDNCLDLQQSAGSDCEVFRSLYTNSCCDYNLPEGMCVATCETTTTATSSTTKESGATETTLTDTTGSTTTRTYGGAPWYVSEGDCVEDGNCITSTNYPQAYPNKDECVITILPTWTGEMYVEAFVTEEGMDWMQIDDKWFSGDLDPLSFGRLIPTKIEWRSNTWARRSGWKICWDNETATLTQTSSTTTTINENLTYGDWNVTSGSCEKVGPCIQSPSYPSSYTPGDVCHISIGPNWTGSVEMEALQLTWLHDLLIINGEVFSGEESDNPHLTGIVPTGQITFLSTNTNPYPGKGFKICWQPPEAADMRESVNWTCTWQGGPCDFGWNMPEMLEELMYHPAFSGFLISPGTYSSNSNSGGNIGGYQQYYNVDSNYVSPYDDPNWNPPGSASSFNTSTTSTTMLSPGGYDVNDYGGYRRRLTFSELYEEAYYFDRCTTWISDTQNTVSPDKNQRHDGHPWCMDWDGFPAECGPCTCSPGQYQEHNETDEHGFTSARSSATYVQCYDCAKGRFSYEEGATGCEACPVGFYSGSTGASVCAFCLRGTYTNQIESTACTECEAGHYQDQYGQSGCISCEAGTYSNETGAKFCTLCPEGYHGEDEAASQCEACGPGTYTDTPGSLECSRCDDGTYSNIFGATECMPCPEGFYSKGPVNAACRPCDPGYYNDQEGQTTCTKCPEMTYANDSGFSECLPCPRGYELNEEQFECTPCGPGSYGSADRECEACDGGTYSNSSGNSECFSCPAGSSAGGPGNVECTLCERGRHQDSEGEQGCHECDQMSATNETGMTECTPCLLGYYASEDRTECVGCEPGTFGDENGECEECWFGTYNSDYGRSECIQCPPGYHAGSLKTTECEPCQPGSYTDQYGEVACNDCDDQSFTNDTNATACEHCPLGYIVNEANTACAACSAGSYGNLQGCQVCHPGEYTDQDGLSVCSKCPPGSMNGFFDQTACILCDPGYYMGDEGATQCESCGSGDYQGSDGATACEVCPLGSIVTSGKTVCEPCPSGQYMNTLYAVQCQLCPLGRASNDTGVTECAECIPGTIGGQAGLTGCVECSPGTYEDDTASERGQCKLCSLGTYTEDYASTACKVCEQGYFTNTQASPSCTACEAGMYQDVEGSSDCGTCPIGWYAFGEGNAECSPCPAGSIAPGMRTETCFLCEPGRYANGTGSSACTNCDVGSYQESSGESACRICWQELSPTGKNPHLWATMQQVVFQGETIWSNLAASTSVDTCGCMTNAWMTPEGECEDCGEGMSCAGMGEVLLLNGYFAPADNGGNVWKCFGKSERCPGGLPGTCAPGRMNESLACTSCEEGFRPDKNGQCAICESGDTSVFFVAFIIVVFGLIGMYIMVHRENPTKKNSAVALVMIMMKQFITIMQMLNLLNLLNLSWPSPFSFALDISAIVGFGIENINANCIVRLEPIKSYLAKAFGVVVLLLIVLIIHAVHMGILNRCRRSKGHRSTLIGSTGTVFAACFISVASSIFAPFQCDLHPNGKLTLTAFSTVVCWSNDYDSPHTTLVAMAMTASHIPLIFLVICIYVTWTLPKRLDTGDTKVLHSYAFLFNKYSPETFWFALVFLIRNLLAALVRVSQDKTVQIFMLAMVWMPVLILLAIVQPWRVPLANYLDIVTETCFLLLLVLAALLVETNHADAPMIGTLSGVLLVVLIVGYALGFAVGIYTRMKEVYGEKLKNQKRIGYYMCYSRQGAGCFARLLGDGLAATNSGEVFQHADASNHMSQWFADVAGHTDMLVVICTKHVLITPWCLGELALAQRHKIPAALVILPDFDWPSENFIVNISDYVRGLVQLAPYSISKAMVQEALRGLSRCPKFHLPLQPDLDSADNIIKSLVALHRVQAGNDAPPAPALVAPENPKPSKVRTFIVCDLTNLEAVSSALVLENMVNPLLSDQESHIKCWQSTERLPDSAQHVIVICSYSCFHQHGLVEHLLDAAERKLPVLPVIVELGFRFPSPVQPKDVDGVFSRDWVTVDRVIQDVFHHSGVLFQPQNPKLILDGQAADVAQRLQGDLPPLSLEKPNTFEVRLTIDELEGFLVTDKNRGCFFNILGHSRDDPDTKFQTSYRGAAELEWYSQFQLEVGDGDTLEFEVMEDNGTPHGRTSVTLWPSQLQANVETDLEPRPLELRMKPVKGCLRVKVMLMGTRVSHKKISGVSKLSEEKRLSATQCRERRTRNVAAIREDEGDEEKPGGQSDPGGWVLETPRSPPEFMHPNSVQIHEPHEDGLKVAVIDTDISITPMQDNDGGSLSPKRTLTPLAPFSAADPERQSPAIHAWKSPPLEVAATGSSHQQPWSSTATPIAPASAEAAAAKQPPSPHSRVVPLSEQHQQFHSRVTKMNDLSSMLEAKKAQIGQRGAGGSTSVSTGASWRQPVENSTAQPTAGRQGTSSQPLQTRTTTPPGDADRDTASKSTSASSCDRGRDAADTTSR